MTPRPRPALSIAAAVLAAGSSRRLGVPKQLLRLDAEALVRRAARLALEAGCRPVAVALGAHREAVAAELAALPVSLVTAPDWHRGMGHSLRAALRHLAAADPGPDAVLVLAVDQPAIGARHLERLLREHRRHQPPATATGYAGIAGAPCVLGPPCLAATARLEGDRGARRLLRDLPGIRVVPCPEAEHDLDTPEDLARWRALPIHPNLEPDPRQGDPR